MINVTRAFLREARKAFRGHLHETRRPLDSIAAMPHHCGVVNARETYHGFLSIQTRGVLALQPEVRKRLLLDSPGAQVEVTEREDGVIELRPQVPIPASQAWFWTDAWQVRERQADEDLAAGRVTSCNDGESFLASLSD